jgi:chemotaxis response regulator CheB
MILPPAAPPRRALIVSSHPLFGEGLRSLLKERQSARVEVAAIAASTDEAVSALTTLAPDLVIVDYDDEVINREQFLARFVEGEAPMRLMLVSLKEGGEAVVYDRRTLAPAQMEDWLEAAVAEPHVPRPSAEKTDVDQHEPPIS